MSMVTATTTEHLTDCRLRADRWRLRDAAACIRPSSMFEVPLDAPSGTPVPFGVVPLALGTVTGEYWRRRLDGLGPEEQVPAFHRSERVRVTYGDAVACIGDTVEITSTVEGRTLTSVVRSPAGKVAEVEQLLSQAAVVAEAAVGQPTTGPLRSPAEQLTRVRVARWAYVGGEHLSVHGNHVAAIRAGLPAAVLPVSLLVGIAERLLFPDNSPLGGLCIEVLRPVYAGDSFATEETPMQSDRRTGPTMVTDRGATIRTWLT
ncbi:MAG: hypothetical protein ACRDOY_08390 [Nocardioidaceae bacterium]